MVTEVSEGGAVGTLFVLNPLDVNVLLYDGEELVGAKQNRILDRAVLLQAQSKAPVPVTSSPRLLRPSGRSSSPSPRQATGEGSRSVSEGERGAEYTYARRNNPRRAELFGRRCRVVATGRMATVLVEFADNRERVTTSRRALRRAPAAPPGYASTGTSASPCR